MLDISKNSSTNIIEMNGARGLKWGRNVRERESKQTNKPTFQVTP